MSLTVHVVSHVKRREWAYDLADKVKADHVWEDDGFLGEWKNHRRALKAASESDADHAVILQDDALPIHGFLDHVAEAVAIEADRPIGLYLGTARPHSVAVLDAVERADIEGACWIETRHVLWGVGVALPVVGIEGFLDFTSVRPSGDYDTRLGDWAAKTQGGAVCTWPSLVDHRDEGTVMKGRSQFEGRRVAHRVGVPAWGPDRRVDLFPDML